jgi:hypothetical protein
LQLWVHLFTLHSHPNAGALDGQFVRFDDYLALGAVSTPESVHADNPGRGMEKMPKN